METLYQLLPGEMIYALGWTVIHSLWQALVLAFLLLLLLSGLSKKPASWRYVAANCVLILQLLVSVITFNLIKQKSPVTESLLPHAVQKGGGDQFIEATTTTPLLEQIQSMFINYFEAHLPLVVLIWLIGTAFFLLRLLGGLVYVQHLRYHQASPLQGEWQAFLENLLAQLNYTQKVSLLSSAAVKVPMVIGYFKPVILVPVGVLTLLTPAELEAVIAHELAHIYRRDFVFNILQTFIESLYYFNPAVWWISAYIRRERENCCDDIAVKLCGNRLSYVKALVKLEEAYQTSPRMAMALAKKGKGRLLLRVKRILNQPQNKSSMMEKFSASILLIIALVCWSIGLSSPNDNALSPIHNTLDAFGQLVQQERNVLVSMMAIDTLPKGKISIQTDRDGKQISAKLKDGKIQSLSIDGEQIPESDFEEYEQTIEEMLSSVPEPPAPPMPPVAPNPPSPPSPPGAPTPPAPPASPSPPTAPKAPKAPKAGSTNDGAGIFRWDNGNVVVEIDTDDDERSVIVINGVDDEGNIFEIEDIQIDGDALQFEDGDFQWQSDDNGMLFVWSDEDKKRITKELKANKKQLKKLEKLGFVDVDDLMETAEFSLESALDNKLIIDDMTFLSNEEGNGFELSTWGEGDFVFLRNEDLSDVLGKELQRDGLTRKDGSYKVELNGKGKFKVNGKKQPDAVAKKYIKIIEGITGSPVNGDYKMTIHKN